MAKYYSGISSGDTLDGMIANGGEYGINPSQDIDCENIECGIITATSGSFSGNVSVGGTLTYEDVKNVDSIGIITARSGIAVTGGQLIVGAAFSVGAAGVVTATSYYGDGQYLSGVTADSVGTLINLNVTGVITTTRFIGTDVSISGITTVSTFKVGTGATIESSGNATLGILTASSVICNTTTIPFYPPVVTTTQRDAMTVTAGAMVYNSSSNKLNYYDGSAWKVVSVNI